MPLRADIFDGTCLENLPDATCNHALDSKRERSESEGLLEEQVSNGVGQVRLKEASVG